MKILLFGKNGHIAQSIQQEAKAAGHECAAVTSAGAGSGLRLDMRDLDAVTRFKLPADDIYDGVVFAQGINPARGIDQITSAEFEDMMRVNVISTTFLVKALRPNVRRGGAFVMLGSAAVRRGSFDPSYGAAKAALEGLMNSFCRYDAEHRYLIVSLALVAGSPVSLSMPAERREQHANTMFGRKLIDGGDVARLILEAIANGSLSRTILKAEGGMWA